MRTLATVLVLSAALGGCLTPSAYNQSKELAGQPLSVAIDRYGPPDQPVTEAARSYSWSHGQFTGACRLSVAVDPAGRITNANVVAVGFETCRALLKDRREGR